MQKILVTGSIAYDILLGYDGSFADALTGSDLRQLSVSFFSPHYAKHHGGTGANIAWNLAALGASPLLVGTVGNDGGEYKALMEERGVETQYVEKLDPYVTATAIIGTDTAERQIAFFHPGADTHGKWPELNEERDDLACAIVSARDAKLMMAGVRWCQKMKVPYVFDPGQQIIGLGRDELLSSTRGCKGLVMNEYEWGLYADRTARTPEKVLKDAEFLIVTRGEKGVTLHEREGVTEINACKADHVTNPTGAGDGFRAGVLAGMASGWSMRDCCRLGTAMGSFVVEIEGTLLDAVDVEEVRTRAEGMYGEALPELS